LLLRQQAIDFLGELNELVRVLLSLSLLAKFSPAVLIFLRGGSGIFPIK
jgi:hypothetical protein